VVRWVFNLLILTPAYCRFNPVSLIRKVSQNRHSQGMHDANSHLDRQIPHLQIHPFDGNKADARIATIVRPAINLPTVPNSRVTRDVWMLRRLQPWRSLYNTSPK
jgi:hypothetical protein